ncbi:hypothetical protein ACFL1X_08825 [Candidatus Hydrogenedentota bacterium]
MDDELRKLEQELEQLKPCGLPPSLEKRIAEEIDGLTVSRRRSFFGVTAWRAAGLAFAGIAVIVAAAIWVTPLSREEQGPGITPAEPIKVVKNEIEFEPGVFQPEMVNTVLLDYQYEGVVETADMTPARMIRYQVVDVAQWRNDEDDRVFRMIVPREETALVRLAVD